MRAVRLLTICAMATIATAANAQGIDWQKVDAAFGRGAAVTGDVHRYGLPRTDLQVTVDGVAIRPAFALGGWAAQAGARWGDGDGRPRLLGTRSMR